MNTLLRVGSAATLSLVMLGLVGCRSSKSDTSTYTGLMSGRGNIPPAYVEVKPIPRVIGGADASTGISVFDEIGGESGFEVESPILEDEVATAEVETVDAPKDAAPATPGHRVLPKVPNGDSVPALATDKSGVRVYVVRGGDTLSRIAAAHGVKTADMMAANPTLKSADKIFVGQKLNLPANAKGVSGDAPAAAQKEAAASAPAAAAKSGAHEAIPADGKYTVRAGDSLWTVARRHGLKSDDIRRWSNLTSDNLQVGQVLILKGEPAAEKAAPAVPATIPAAPVSDDQPVIPADDVAAPAIGDPAVEDVAKKPFQHLVMSGDTLESIASYYDDITVESILQANPQIKSNADLKEGMEINIILK